MCVISIHCTLVSGRRDVFDELELVAQRMNLKLNSDETKREFSFQHDCFSLKVVVADDGGVSNVILTQNLESKVSLFACSICLPLCTLVLSSELFEVCHLKIKFVHIFLSPLMSALTY